MFFDRVILVVMDSVGIGAQPDAAAWGDAGRDTLGHIAEHRGLHVTNFVRLGLANIRPLAGLAPAAETEGAYGKATLLSPGKDTTAGHWEMAGIILDRPFPTYPHGFPQELLDKFEQAIERKTLGNYPASGTEIIKQLGAEHLKTGWPIVYTSGDSVFQIAAHEGVISIEELYRLCRIARELLQGEHRVGRVIARPFVGEPGSFRRTERRHDYAVEPPRPMLLDVLKEAALDVIGVGKIPDIFLNRGITRALPGQNNLEALESTLAAIKQPSRGLVFTNLVDFDMLYGHRLDIEGYGRALEDVDAFLPRLLSALRRRDLLIFTADHGCDPLGPSTDHSREYVPILATGPSVPHNVNLGTRATLADIGQTIAANFGLTIPHGSSFLGEITAPQPPTHCPEATAAA
ncbi:MAG TPA: phosphopentomutase [Terriglobia bacterium]|nr:phosphopentomutase [Terriglobia bacterium]